MSLEIGGLLIRRMASVDSANRQSWIGLVRVASKSRTCNCPFQGYVARLTSGLGSRGPQVTWTPRCRCRGAGCRVSPGDPSKGLDRTGSRSHPPASPCKWPQAAQDFACMPKRVGVKLQLMPPATNQILK